MDEALAESKDAVQDARRERALQRTMAELIFEPGAGEAFERNPKNFGEGQGLEARDTAALSRFKDRLGIYRDLARASLEEPLQNIFPISKALLAWEWEDCVSTFLAARSVRSPHYRDIAPAFVAWLSESAWGHERWPSLLSLAHFEYVEVMVARWPGEAPTQALSQEPSPDQRIVLSEGAQVLTYEFAVHQATVETPVPPRIPTHLLVFGDADGDFRMMELTPATAAFLVRASMEPLHQARVSLGIEDEEELFQLLSDLRGRGAILGFKRSP